MLRDLDAFNGWLNTLHWPIALVLSLLAIAGLLGLFTWYGVTVGVFCHLCRGGWRDLRQQDLVDRLREGNRERDVLIDRMASINAQRIAILESQPNVLTLEAASGEQDS